MQIVVKILLVALLSTFLILVMEKWKVVEWVQVNGNRLFSKMFSCILCLSFWMGFVVCVIYVIFTKDYISLLIPVFSAPITRKLR
jgi:hypothetical protein